MRNPTRIRLFASAAPTALLLIGASCRQLQRELQNPPPDPEVEHASITKVQLGDIPAPEGFALVTKTLESYSYERGSFRSGRLIYRGTTPPSQVAAYLRERIPQHGWLPLEEASPEAGERHLWFRKGRTRLTCEITRERTSEGTRTILRYFLVPESAVARAPSAES